MHQPGITVIFYVSHHAQNSRVQSNFLACEEEDRKKKTKTVQASDHPSSCISIARQIHRPAFNGK